MNIVSGDRLWIKKNPILKTYPYLTENLECDVAIIGAGVIGAICAYYLIEANIDTVVVDKNIIGYGSTSASTSILQYEIDYDLMELKHKIGEENAVRGFKLCEKAVYDIKNIVESLEDKCDFALRECLYYTSNINDVKKMKKEYEYRKQNGFAVEFLDKESAESRFSFPVEAGIYSTKGAAQIDPYRLAHELLSYGSKKGLKVFENTEIIKTAPVKEGITMQTTVGKSIRAKKVILATGYEYRNFIQETVDILDRTYTIVTKPVKDFAGWYNRCIIRDNNTPYIYLRTTADNRIIIGGEDNKVGGKNSRTAQLRNMDKTLEQKYSTLLTKLQSMFPEISGLEIDYRFNGLFAESKDGLPFIGEYPGMANLYICLCTGSNGILYGILGGQLIRDMYQQKYSADFELMKFDRKS